MNIIIIGATTGIGRELYNIYTRNGDIVGIIGRRTKLLEELYNSNPHNTYYQTADVMDIAETNVAMQTLRTRLGGIDMVIVCAGTGDLNPELTFEKELPTLQTNVIGWTNIVDQSYTVFEEQGYGHLVLITSIGGLRGEPAAPAYSATKAYQINYAEALAKKAYKSAKPIYITDIRPGFVDTAMAKGEGLFWVMPVQKVALQIFKAIQKKASREVVTKRWRVLAYLIKNMPFGLYKKI